jgi:serine/threonine-protein kinase HipA
VKLDVQVKGKTVAQLYRERDEYLLSYNADATPLDFVSLTMPVREAPWAWPRDMHPFFRQNLPEGYLLSVIREEFGPYLDGTDLSLLAVIGGTGIGRVTVTPEGTAPGTELQPLNISDLLHGDNTTEHFASLVHTYARAAISGAVPKFIAPESSPGILPHPLGKSTIRTSRHIIKGSDDKTPFLGFNEHYSMRVLECAGVARVAKTAMSDDGRVLIVERFDVDEAGFPHAGVEDACGLLGLPPHEKYMPSTERVLAATRAYLPQANTRKQLEQLGWLLLTNYVVRNADCHSKNIALYYTTATDAAYTPAYDIVTTQAYPAYAANPPGLSIDGRKTWAAGKTLERFFNTRLGIAPKTYHLMVEQLCDSAVSVAHEMVEAANGEKQWRWIAGQMLHAWNEGMASLRSAKPNARLRSLTPLIETAGFSEADKADGLKRIIGRSELLAPRDKNI